MLGSYDNGDAQVERWGILAPVGRIIASLLFFGSTITDLFDPSGINAELAAKHFPLPHIVSPATILFQLVAATCLVLGFQTRWAALALALFCFIASSIFHFDPKVPTEFHQWAKDISLGGALLVLVAMPPSPFSLDRLRAKRQQAR
jgi:putative oxidoreductase